MTEYAEKIFRLSPVSSLSCYGHSCRGMIPPWLGTTVYCNSTNRVEPCVPCSVLWAPFLTGCFLRLCTCSFSVARCNYLISCFAIMHGSTWIEEGMRESKSIHVSALETYFTLSSHPTFSYVSLSCLSSQLFLCQLIAHSFSLSVFL